VVAVAVVLVAVVAVAVVLVAVVLVAVVLVAVVLVAVVVAVIVVAAVVAVEEGLDAYLRVVLPRYRMKGLVVLGSGCTRLREGTLFKDSRRT
jgi:hypothetical protein